MFNYILNLQMEHVTEQSVPYRNRSVAVPLAIIGICMVLIIHINIDTFSLLLIAKIITN